MTELKISEIRKAEHLANKISGKKDCKVSGWFTDGAQGSFQQFICEILSEGGMHREDDIEVNVYLPDRRRSFARLYYGD